MIHKVDGNSYNVYTKPKKVDIPDTGEKFSLGYQKDQLSSELQEKKEKEVSDQAKQQAAEQGGVRIELSSKGMEKQKQAELPKTDNGAGGTSLLASIRTFLATTVAAFKDIFTKIWNDPQPEVMETADMSEIVNVEAEEITEMSDPSGMPEMTGMSDATGTTGMPEMTETSDTTGITGMTENAEMSDLAGVTGMTGTTDNTEMSNLAGTAGMPKTTENAVILQRTGPTASVDASHTDEKSQEREIRRHLQNGDMSQVIRLLTDNGRKTVARNSTLLTYYDKNGKVVELDASVQDRTLHGDRNTRKL